MGIPIGEILNNPNILQSFKDSIQEQFSLIPKSLAIDEIIKIRDKIIIEYYEAKRKGNSEIEEEEFLQRVNDLADAWIDAKRRETGSRESISNRSVKRR